MTQNPNIEELAQRVDSLESEVEHLRDLTTATDENGKQWTASKLITELGLTRRQAIVVIGMLASGSTLIGALTRSTSAQSASDASGPVYFDQIGDSNNPVSEFYVDQEYQAASDQNPVFDSVTTSVLGNNGSAVSVPDNIVLGGAGVSIGESDGKGVFFDTETIGDDSAKSFNSGSRSVVIISSASQNTGSGIFLSSFSSLTVIGQNGMSYEGNTTLSGTDGPDGSLNISISDNNIYLENRTGVSNSYTITQLN